MAKFDIAEGKGALELRGGILRLRWKAGETIRTDDALEALSHLQERYQGKSYPMLIPVESVTFSRSARKLLTSPGCASRIALLGSSPVDHVIALFFLHGQATPCPTMYFTSLRKAMTWLRDGDPQRKVPPHKRPALPEKTRNKGLRDR